MLAGTEFMAAAVILIVLAALVLFITEWLPLPVTAMSVAVAFYLIGAVDASTALKSFSSSTAMIIAAMAIIGEAVFKTGGAEKIGELLTKVSKDERHLIFVIVIFSGIMSGFLSNTGAAALLIALILGMCSSTGMKRSKLMYPVIVGWRRHHNCGHYLRTFSPRDAGGPEHGRDDDVL